MGFLTNPGGLELFWGGVPSALRAITSLNMLLAASGYITIFFVLLLVVPSTATVGKLPFGIFNLIYLSILVPSALWMPLNQAVINTYTQFVWFCVVLVLALTALAAIALLIALLSLRPGLPTYSRTLVIISSVFFILQTAVLDAILRTAFFRN